MPDDLHSKLMGFLERLNDKEVEWGVDDCSAMAAAWARECGHPVQIPSYSGRKEAHRLIDGAGGLVALWDRAAASAGVPERNGEPKLGDVGIIPTDRFGPVGIIFASANLCCWRLKRNAFWLSPRTYLKVWAIS